MRSLEEIVATEDILDVLTRVYRNRNTLISPWSLNTHNTNAAGCLERKKAKAAARLKVLARRRFPNVLAIAER